MNLDLVHLSSNNRGVPYFWQSLLRTLIVWCLKQVKDFVTCLMPILKDSVAADFLSCAIASITLSVPLRVKR